MPEEHSKQKKQNEPQSPLIDPEYVRRIHNRSILLEKKSLASRESVKATKMYFERGKTELAMEIASLNTELNELDEQIHTAVDMVKSAVDKFQYVAKAGDLKRLQQRVDAWAPEQKISRDKYKQLLEDSEFPN